MQVHVPSTEILIAASGETQAAQNNARGHLFEHFVAQLMAFYGYEEPRRENLNVSASGVELDIRSTHQMTRHTMVAECKAYSSAVPAKELAAFYGKVCSQRFDTPNLFGYFVAIPSLTKDGQELQRKYEVNDSNFRVLSGDHILDLLADRRVILSLQIVVSAYGQAPIGPLADQALIITQAGLFYAVHELSQTTRLPIRVLVVPASMDKDVPPLVLDLVRGLSAFSKGLPCAPVSSAGTRTVSVASSPEPIVEVTGSSSDFEYQFPAAPKFFVGRDDYLSEARRVLDSLRPSPEASCRAQVLVLNAQSGWGKSSLALRLVALTRELGGDGLCIDTRTANQITFVASALRHALLLAAQRGQLTLSADATFSSVSSVLAALKGARYAVGKPICICFDQFENVFQNSALAREFRDLALGIVELNAPILLSFCWKTDVVAFTEDYPYQLRDDIRSQATVFSLRPFGPKEIGQLLTRLQRDCGQKVHPYVRERVREYSQGLPWLFKKLGSHLIREIRAGTTQDELLAEVLNIQNLFESDVQNLGVAERKALGGIARRAPLAVADAVDLAGGAAGIIQSLVNQRLLVSIGDKLDVYWDVFRDYLNQGTVPLQDSYVLRLTPNGVRKLLGCLRDAASSLTPDQAAVKLRTSTISVLNMARELRQLGVLAAQEGVLRFADDVAAADDLNRAIQVRAASALKRHRVFSLLQSLTVAGRVSIQTFTDALPKAYPAVAAKHHTWDSYSRAFVYWFQYAGLISIRRDEVVFEDAAASEIDLLAPGKARATRLIPVFPRCAPQSVLHMIGAVGSQELINASSANGRALLDAKHLGLLEGEFRSLRLTRSGRELLATHGAERTQLIRSTIQGQVAFQLAVPLLETDPGCSPVTIGSAIARQMGLDWSATTAQWVGKQTRAWMRAAGFATKLKAARPSAIVQQSLEGF